MLAIRRIFNCNRNVGINCKYFSSALYKPKVLLQPQKNVLSKHTNFAQRFSINKDIKSKNVVGKWLLTCSGMVFVAVALGGVTRLTESGLSMVTWKFLGEKMPRNTMEWEKEFEMYKQFPEFQMKNQDMTLNEFKFIFYMEYIHRQWGRAIGLVYIVPAVILWKRGYFCTKTKRVVTLLGSLLGIQGLMGWYMVKSGLENRFDDVNDVPRVSHFRLASHLGLAFVIYSIFLSTAFSQLISRETYISATQKLVRLKKFSIISTLLVFTTAVSGAFVAGLDAGLVYNSFPKMGDKWIPSDILALQPVARNFLENPTTVQFDHRILGITTVSLISYVWLYAKQINLPKRSRWAINSLFVMAWIQSSLGISTLLNHVPVPLASSHQSGSLLLLSFAIWLFHELRFVRYIIK